MTNLTINQNFPTGKVVVWHRWNVYIIILHDFTTKKKKIRGWSDRPSKLRHRGSAKILGIAVHKPLQKRPDHSNLVSKGSNSIAKTWILNLNRKDEASNPRTHKLHQVYIPLALVLLMQCQCHLFVKIYVSTLSTSNKDVDHSICHYWQAYKVERWRWYRNVSVFFFFERSTVFNVLSFRTSLHSSWSRPINHTERSIGSSQQSAMQLPPSKFPGHFRRRIYFSFARNNQLHKSKFKRLND